LDLLFNADIVTIILNLSDPKYSLRVRVDSTLILLNILRSATELHTQALDNLGLLPILFTLLDEPYPSLNEHVVCILKIGVNRNW